MKSDSFVTFPSLYSVNCHRYWEYLPNQCHVIKLVEISLGLKGNYICRKLHEHVGTGIKSKMITFPLLTFISYVDILYKTESYQFLMKLINPVSKGGWLLWDKWHLQTTIYLLTIEIWSSGIWFRDNTIFLKAFWYCDAFLIRRFLLKIKFLSDITSL